MSLAAGRKKKHQLIHYIYTYVRTRNKAGWKETIIFSLTPAVSGTSSLVSAGALTAMTVWSRRLSMERMSWYVTYPRVQRWVKGNSSSKMTVWVDAVDKRDMITTELCGKDISCCLWTLWAVWAERCWTESGHPGISLPSPGPLTLSSERRLSLLLKHRLQKHFPS